VVERSARLLRLVTIPGVHAQQLITGTMGEPEPDYGYTGNGKLYSDMVALGIHDDSALYADMFQLVGNGTLDMDDWECIKSCVRSFRQGLSHVDSPWEAPSMRCIYAKLRSVFPIFKGKPPPEHPFPAAYFDVPARPSTKARKSKKLRRRRR
jgi:hypothetical protein